MAVGNLWLCSIYAVIGFKFILLTIYKFFNLLFQYDIGLEILNVSIMLILYNYSDCGRLGDARILYVALFWEDSYLAHSVVYMHLRSGASFFVIKFSCDLVGQQGALQKKILQPCFKNAAIAQKNMAIGRFRLQPHFFRPHSLEKRGYRPEGSMAIFLQTWLQARTNGYVFINVAIVHTLAAFVKCGYW